MFVMIQCDILNLVEELLKKFLFDTFFCKSNFIFN